MTDAADPIAIVGLAGRMPGASDIQQYWRNLHAGRETISFLSDDEMLGYGVSPEILADDAFVRAVPLVPQLQEFDADLFGLTAREAQICDPQVRLFLEASHGAIENAGLDPTRTPGDVGVFGSCGPIRYPDLYVYGALVPWDPSVVAVNSVDHVSTFTAFKLNLQGPAVTVQTACSSSLVAVHLACQALQLGDCDLALAGGANVELPYGHGYRWGPGSVRSRDGHCRPFDAAADGTVFGSGTGVVLLKRLSDALADGDYIRAVIHGGSVTNDGSAKMSFSAPSVERQAATIAQAMAVAGRDPADISYVEAHGTGTAAGDPIEVAALGRAYDALRQADQLPAASIPIGSVKGNIGHLVQAAGVAGLIKLVLALENEQIPASINFTEPHPNLNLAATPFFINDRLRPWPRTPDRTRWAAISALGVGGTNCHLVLSEGPQRVPTPHETRPRIVVWSGRSAAAAEATRTALGDYFAGCDEDVFADAVTTLQLGRTAHPVRGAVVAATPAEAVSALQDKAVTTTAALDRPDGADVVFLFPGHGSQYRRMAADLYRRQKVFTDAADRCFDELSRTAADLRECWLDGDEPRLRQTRNAQPLLFIVEYGLALLFQHWGINPAAVLGHSVGELVAVAVAGVLDPEDAVRLVELRGRLMQQMPAGGMLAVGAEPEAVRPLLPPEVTVAVVNGPRQTVVSGPPDAIERAAEKLAAQPFAVRRLPIPYAFHSAAMAGAIPALRAGFEAVTLRPPTRAVYSAATGRLLTADEATDPDFWARQIAEPVWFGPALDRVLNDGDRMLVEVGPGTTLTGLARKHPAVRARRSAAVASVGQPDRAGGDEQAVLRTLAELWVNGHGPNWTALSPQETVRRVPVPGYPYQRQRHWVDPTTGPAASRVGAGQLNAGQLNAGQLTEDDSPTPQGPVADVELSPFSTVTWVERPALAPPRQAGAGSAALALLPPELSVSAPVLDALRRSGFRVTCMRPGASYAVTGREFQVRPGERSDLDRVLDDLAAAGESPALLVHAWTLGPPEPVTSTTVNERLALAFHGLHTVIQAAGRATVGGRLPRLLVLTNRAVDVSGGEEVDPIQAMLPAEARTAAAEEPGLSCRVVDVTDGVVEDLADEFRSPDDEPLVALRGNRRWVPRERPCTVEVGRLPIRRDGVYLITGGLGGLGLEVAKELAATGLQPRIVLIGRTPPADPVDRDRPGAVGTATAEMAALGAEVHVHAADVADPRALARVLDITMARVGPVTGVFHLAGVAGDGMLQLRHREAAEAVLRPKVHGTLALAEAFAKRPRLDFFVCFSSRAALSGMVGSGDYAAANAFLDAFAGSRSDGLGRRLSIGWPAWSTVGMAAVRRPDGGDADEPGAADEGVRHHLARLSAADCWALDEHRVDGRPVLPGTAHLDLAVRAFRAVAGAAPDAPLALDDVVFSQPLVADEARQARVTFRPAGDRWRFQIASRPDEPEGAWREHVEGYIAECAPPSRVVSLDGIKAGLEPSATPSLAPGGNRMFTLGPRWRNIAQIWSAGAVQLARLALPAVFHADLDEHILHPTLLDSATAILRNPQRDPLHMPFRYRRLVLYKPLPAELYSHVRRHDDADRMITGDMDLIAADGTVVAEIQGYAMRRVDREAFGTGRDSPAADRAPHARGTTPPASTDGIDPEIGVRLLFDLLSARTPAHILVRPYRGRVPVPLADLTLGDAPVASPTEVRAAGLTRAGLTRAPGQPGPLGPSRNGAGDVDATHSIEDRVRALWTEVLGVNDIAPAANFFDLGGDSLSAVELMGRLRDVFRIEFGIGALFDYPTVAQLATALREQGAQ